MLLHPPLRTIAVAVLFAAALVAPWPAATRGEAGVRATIIGTEAAAVLTCPRPGCRAQGEIEQGASLTITGEAVDGFFPVRADGKQGFVYGSYLFRYEPEVVPPSVDRGSTGCDRVALIFNVGAGYDPATGILDTLVAEDVPATMFVMGWWAERNPTLLRRMQDDGFPIGSHGHLPPELTLRGDDDVAADVWKATAAIEAAGGEPPGPWFTPFAAAIDDRVRTIVAAQGYLPIGWSVPTDDWSPDATADAIYSRVVDNVHDGAIVELHLDASTSADSTAVALPWIVAELRDRGYEFVTIPEMVEPCG